MLYKVQMQKDISFQQVVNIEADSEGEAMMKAQIAGVAGEIEHGWQPSDCGSLEYTAWDAWEASNLEQKETK